MSSFQKKLWVAGARYNDNGQSVKITLSKRLRMCLPIKAGKLSLRGLNVIEVDVKERWIYKSTLDLLSW